MAIIAAKTAVSRVAVLLGDCSICDPRVLLRIHLHDRTIATEIAAKSLRKAQTAIREIGADNIALVLQGHLVAGDRVAEAGLSAQPKSPLTCRQQK